MPDMRIMLDHDKSNCFHRALNRLKHILASVLLDVQRQGENMSYTLKKSISGLTLDDIKRIYDANPNMTLKELSNLTGYAIPFLKKILMERS